MIFRTFPFLSVFLAAACGVFIQPLHAGPTEDALKMGEESYAAGEKDSAITAWANAYNERATANTANDETCAKLLLKTGSALTELNRRPAALQCFEKLYPLTAAIHGAKAPETGVAGSRLCELLVDTGGDLDRAERLSNEAVAILSTADESHLEDRFMAMINAAYVLLGKKDRLGANKKLIECLELYKQKPQIPQARVGHVHLMLSDISSFFGRSKDQVRHSKTGLDYIAHDYGSYHARTINAAIGVANILPAAERRPFLEAQVKAVESAPADKRDKDYHMAAAAIERILALTIFTTERKRAIDLLKQSVRHGAQGWGETSGELVTLYVDLAKLLLIEQRYDEGVECYQKVLVIRKQLLGDDHESTIETQRILDGLIAEVNKVR